jgi:hypothetical protein
MLYQVFETKVIMPPRESVRATRRATCKPNNFAHCRTVLMRAFAQSMLKLLPKITDVICRYNNGYACIEYQDGKDTILYKFEVTRVK